MSDYQLFSPLSDIEYAALRDDIAARGVLVPVEEDEHGCILDGHHRVRIARELGIDYPRIVRAGLTEEEKRRHVRKVNLLRRHLAPEQKRAIIAAQLKETPEKSDRIIAGMLGVSNKTVSSLRADLVASGELCNIHSSIGADGKERPRERAPRAVLARNGREAAQVQAALQAFPDPPPPFTPAEETRDRSPLDAPELELADPVIKQARKLAQPAPTETPPLPDGRFDVLLADPPWQTNFRRGTSRDVEEHYPTLSEDGIGALPVHDIAAVDCVLFLWATSPLLPAAFRILAAWGFEYKTSMVWVKNGIGMGFYARIDHEFLLIATRGAPGIPPPDARPSSVVHADKGRHSEKPDRVRELIEEMYPGTRRAELFCRSPRAGWAAWGNEVTADKSPDHGH